jgi:CelD/BcsL family acetyltransferase involved in cellulose biosynthesis
VARDVTSVRVSSVSDFAALGERWRALEQRADASFFQSWTWYGCLAAERFSDPVLVEATEVGRTVALALFNRVPDRLGPPRLYLGEAGQAALDCPYIEQNGVLTERGREADLAVSCLRAVAAEHVLVLSGIGPGMLAAVRQAAALGWVKSRQESPCIDLARIRAEDADYLAERSANTRQQVRRSDRSFAHAGPVHVERAEAVPAALAMLDEMADLHQATWTARGQPGCVAKPFFRRFHAALITVALPRGEAVLLRVRADGQTIGVLYNFAFRGRMYAYQSGLAYGSADARAKPGLSCHYAAIRDSLARGFDSYDFLAGDDRYKRSLSDHAHPQFWAEAGPAWAPRLLMRKAWRAFR